VPSGIAADELTTEDLLHRLQAHDVPAVAVTTDLGALPADPRFAYAPHRPPWEFT
jgi:hypothetical protein